MRATSEHELKLDAPAGFRLPPLGGRPLAPRVFTSVDYDVPGEVSWRRVSGDLRDLAARFTVLPREDGHSDVTASVEFDAGFYVPGPVRSLVRDQALRGWLRDLDRHLTS